MVTVSFLFSPQPSSNKDYFGEYIRINKSIGFTVNGDAYGYFLPAKIPALLFKHGEIRQSRPLFILVGTLIGYPFYLLLKPFGVRDFYSFYLGFILLNVLILYLSLLVFEKLLPLLLNRNVGLEFVIPLEIILISNQVTKAFFWTIHQQMFCFLAPLLCIYLMLMIVRRHYSSRQIDLIFLAAGVFLLLYGSFVLFLPLLLLAVYLSNDKRLPVRTSIKYVGLFFLPMVLWIIILKLAGTGYYNYEMGRFRQFVWVVDSLKKSLYSFWRTLGHYTIRYLYTFREIMIFFGISAWLSLYIWSKRKAENRFSLQLPDIVLQIVLLSTLFIFALFFWLLGYYADRLTLNLFPVCLCLIIYQTRFLPYVKNLPRKFWLATMVWHMINMYSYGPFS